MQFHYSISKDIAAVILSGGLSTRMGRDKAILQPYGDCEPDLLARTNLILTKYFTKIWVSCAQNKPRLGYDCLIDEFNCIGPISGIYAGLRAAHEAKIKAILVLACDLPLINDQLITNLITARHEHRSTKQDTYNLMTTFYHEESQNIEALASIYEVDALPLFKKAIEQGIRAPRLVILEHQRTLISCTPNITQALFNLNTAAEYVEFKKNYQK